MRTLKWVLAALAVAITARAYVLNYDDSGVYVNKWQTSPISLQVKLSNTRNLSDGNSQASCVLAAMDIWNAQLGTERLSGTITSGSTATQSNGVNEIVMASKMQGQDFGAGVLAVTLISTRGNSFAETDLLFNTAYTWDSYRGALQYGKQDMRRIAIHELGHVLGLDHPDEAGQYVTAIMNSHESDIDTVQDDDVWGVHVLYGSPGSVPTNDAFASAINLNWTSQWTGIPGSNVQATHETGEPNHAGSTGAHSVWWKWTAPADGGATVDTLGSNFDTVLAVYTGSSVNTLTLVGENDDEETPEQNSTPQRKRTSKVTFPISSGTTYYFVVDGWGDADGVPSGYTGDTVMNLRYGTLPVINEQPRSDNVDLGQAVNFSVSATGTAPLTYQWRRDGAALTDTGTVSGTTTAILHLSGAQAGDAGDYTVVVTNAAGPVTSTPAKLIVARPPTFTTRPASQLAVEGQGVSFQAAVDGSSGAVTYQWRHNRQIIPGATGATLAIPSATVADAGYYDLAITNQAGGVARCVVYLAVAISDPVIMEWGTLAPTPPAIVGPVATVEDGDPVLALKGDGTIVTWGQSSSTPANVPPSLSNIVAISNGTNQMFALKNDGTVVGWGTAPAGQISPPAGLTGVVAISTTYNYCLALKNDGTVVAWGSSVFGCTSVPNDLRNVVAISASPRLAIALRADGTVVAWGDELSFNGVVPAGLSEVVAISGGALNYLALRSDMTVVHWGQPYPGYQPIPATAVNVIAIKAGGYFNLALRSDGTVVAWGDWDNDNTTVPEGLGGVVAIAGSAESIALGRSMVPKITSQPVAKGVAAGEYVAFSVVANGSVPMTYQWRKDGVNLGEGGEISGANKSTLQLLTTMAADAGAYDVVVSNRAGSTTSVAVALTINPPPAFTVRPLSRIVQLGTAVTITAAVSDGAAVTYQWKHNGRIIPGANAPSLTLGSVSVADSGSYEIVASNAVANAHSVMFLNVVHGAATNSTVAGWGRDQYGTSGAATVPKISHVVSIAAGTYNGMALIDDGTIRVWGEDYVGVVPAPTLSDVVAVAVGRENALALHGNGLVTSWGGSNAYGPIPVPADLSDVIAISVRGANDVALKSDGTVVCWNQDGSPPPAGLKDVVAIAAGFYHTLALKADGTVVGWDSNGYGQGTPPSGLSGVVAIAAGMAHSLALKSDGTVVAWGDNTNSP